MPMDFISGAEGGQLTAHGSLAETLLANNMNVNCLRTLETLRKEEWLALDTTVLEVARERLNGIADLFDRNLTFDVPNPMGITVIQHQTQSEMVAAEMTMDGVTRTQNDRILFSLVSTPLPITHQDFFITARVLAASRNSGQPLDTAQVAEATQQVTEKLETVLFTGLAAGDTLGFGSSTAILYGYTNRPNRNTVSLFSSGWASATGAQILADVLSMVNSAHTDNMFGPYILYVPGNYWIELLDDFNSNYPKTVLARLLEIPEIQAIKPVDKLTDSNVLLVQMTRNNVDLAVGLQPTTVFWETQGGMKLNFKVMAIMIPRIKLTYTNQSGVVHGS